MDPFTDSTALLDDPEAIQARFADDGYIFCKGAVDRDMLTEVRREITAICDDLGWFVEGSDPMEARSVIEPTVEGEDRYHEAYTRVQRLESFHAVSHHPSVHRVMEAVLGPTVFPHPLSIARLVFPGDPDWATPEHQDYPNNQGTPDLLACWMPTADCPVEGGSLKVLEGSHNRGLAPLTFSLGAGNRKAVVDERFDGLRWVAGDFELGDCLVFHSLTVHQSLPNTTDAMRISVDYRFQREAEPLTIECLEPHFGREDWETIYAGWERDDLKYYWRDKDYPVVPWDDELHALPEAEGDEAMMEWFRYRQRRKHAHAARHGIPLDELKGRFAGPTGDNQAVQN